MVLPHPLFPQTVMLPLPAYFLWSSSQLWQMLVGVPVTHDRHIGLLSLVQNTWRRTAVVSKREVSKHCHPCRP